MDGKTRAQRCCHSHAARLQDRKSPLKASPHAGWRLSPAGILGRVQQTWLAATCRQTPVEPAPGPAHVTPVGTAQAQCSKSKVRRVTGGGAEAKECGVVRQTSCWTSLLTAGSQAGSWAHPLASDQPRPTGPWTLERGTVAGGQGLLTYACYSQADGQWPAPRARPPRCCSLVRSASE